MDTVQSRASFCLESSTNNIFVVRRDMLRAIRLVSLIFILCFAAGALAQDAATNCADMCKVVLDNEHVRVIEYNVKAGGKVPMHSHPGSVTYFITGGKMKTTMPDGKTTEMDRKEGEAVWSDAVTHANENIGGADARVIVVEMKHMPAKK